MTSKLRCPTSSLVQPNVLLRRTVIGKLRLRQIAGIQRESSDVEEQSRRFVDGAKQHFGSGERLGTFALAG